MSGSFAIIWQGITELPLTMHSPVYPWALTGIFAAFHLVVSLLPYTPAGAGFITWGMVSAALVGLILGPLYGTISVGIGSVLTMIAFPSVAVISIFTPLAPMAGALTAGALVTRRPWIVYGLFILTILLFIVGPIGPVARGFLWLHYVTLVFSFFYAIPGISAKLRSGLALSEGTGIAVVGLSYWFTGFCALMADSLIGSALWQYYAISIGYDVATLGGIYVAIMFVYPVERGLASIVLAAIAIATSRAMASAHLGLPLVGHRVEEEVKLLRAE